MIPNCVSRLVLAVLALQGLALLQPASAQVAQIPPGGITMTVIPQEVEQVEEESEYDNTVIAAGHNSPALPCTPGTQAYVTKTDSGGAQVWLLSANADLDCDGDGNPDPD